MLALVGAGCGAGEEAGWGGFGEGDGGGRMGCSGGAELGSWLAVWASGGKGGGDLWMEGIGVRLALGVEDLSCVRGVGIRGEGAFSAVESAATFSSAGDSTVYVLG